MAGTYVVGIDEAGRGPLAGPVSVGVVAIPKRLVKKYEKLFLPIDGKDSKKLTEKERERWFRVIMQEKKEGSIVAAYSHVSASVIDKNGISKAISVAIERSLEKLNISPKSTEVLLDGLLKAPEEYKKQRTIIKGDETHLPIRLASIVAKVTRDAKMIRLSRAYPEYDFAVHKGYGTKKHREMIKKHGLSFVHRKSFCKNIVLKTPKNT